MCVRVSSCWLFVGWENKNCQSFSGWHTKRLKKLIFTFYRVSTKNRPLENARALYWIRGKIFSTKKNSWILRIKNKRQQTLTIMQLKLRGQPYIMCVVSFIFGCCLFCFHDKFIVYYRYGAQFVVSFLFFTFHLFRWCALLLPVFLLALCARPRQYTGVIKEDVSKLAYLQLKHT